MSRRKIFAALSQKNLFITLILGFASGLPFPLIFGTLQAWLTREKIDLSTIGLFSLVSLPYAFKFLWAPLLDKFNPPFLGRRTGWIAIFQLCLAGAIILMGTMNPHVSLWMLAIMSLSVSWFSASQDIVVDAYRSDLLSQEERGLGAALAVMGYRIALLISGALALILSDHIDWQTIYLIMGCLMAFCSIATWFAPPTKEETSRPSITEAFVQPLKDLWQRPNVVPILLFVLLYKLGDSTAAMMTTPFLVQIGFTGTEIGAVQKGFGLLSTIAGGLAGGALMTRLSLGKALFGFGILQAVSNLLFAAVAWTGPERGMLILAIAGENICGGLGTTAYTALLMGLCNRKFSATQYALLSSIMAVTRNLAGVFSGYMAESLGWQHFFVTTSVLAVPGLLLLLVKGLRTEINKTALQG